MERYFIIEKTGARRQLTRPQVEEHVARGDASVLERIEQVAEDGKVTRPWRFNSVEPPRYREDGTVEL